MSNDKTKFLYDWKLKLAILSAIVIPSISATGAFYKMEIRINEKTQQTENRINKLELDAERNFAGKQTMDKLRDDVSTMHDDIIEIKTILKRKLR